MSLGVSTLWDARGEEGQAVNIAQVRSVGIRALEPSQRTVEARDRQVGPLVQQIAADAWNLGLLRGTRVSCGMPRAIGRTTVGAATRDTFLLTRITPYRKVTAYGGCGGRSYGG